jgi:hypothetical protein
VLTALSLLPDLIVAAGPATRVLLMATHLVAAAIVNPATARRLPRLQHPPRAPPADPTDRLTEETQS